MRSCWKRPIEAANSAVAAPVTATTAMAAGVGGKVRVVAIGHNSMPGIAAKLQDEYKAKFNDDWYTIQTYTGLGMLAAGMAKAKTIEPVAVAKAMSGIKFEGLAGEVEMRKTDHQLQQPLFITVWQKTDAKYPYSAENTGMTLVPVATYDSYVSSTPTSCQMKRPG